MSDGAVIRIATRGSELALAQANWVRQQLESAFPERRFELSIIRTTGDRMQTAALNDPLGEGAKGLFTKELEAALLSGEADLAVHSLKDLPTQLPEGLILGAITEREDARDVLVFRDASAGHSGRGFDPGAGLDKLPEGAVAATSSTRRQAQLLDLRPNIKVVPIRGNVGTRLRKLAEQDELDATILAAAGLVRLGFTMDEQGRLARNPERGEPPPEGLIGKRFDLSQMLPCVGQAALGIEIRAHDPRMIEACQRLAHGPSAAAALAERAFLREMGGGCLSPVAAYGEVHDGTLWLRAVSFNSGAAKRGERRGAVADAEKIGTDLAKELK